MDNNTQNSEALRELDTILQQKTKEVQAEAKGKVGTNDYWHYRGTLEAYAEIRVLISGK